MGKAKWKVVFLIVVNFCRAPSDTLCEEAEHDVAANKQSNQLYEPIEMHKRVRNSNWYGSHVFDIVDGGV